MNHWPITATAAVQPDWSRVRRVLLIRLRSIGDTVLMTPTLSAIKSYRPDIELSVLMEPLSAPVLVGNPLVDRLLVTGPSFSSRAHAIRELRKVKPDVAFNLHGGSTATMIARLSGARWTAGYAGLRYSGLLKLNAPDPDVILNKTGIHSVEQQLALVCWAGIPWPASTALQLHVEPAAAASVKERLQTLNIARFAIVAPAAAFESKMWPAEHFGAICDHIYEKWGVTPIVIAGAQEDSIARTTAARAKTDCPVFTDLSLPELIALIAQAKVFVGNDSGPAHIAAAFGIPAVVIFGSSNPSVWRPWTNAPHRVIEPEKLGLTPGADGEPSGHPISRIPLKEVIAATNELIQNRER